MTVLTEKKILLGFGAALLVMLCTGVAAWRNPQRLKTTSLSVDPTHQVLTHLERATTGVLSTQTSTRGFVISGEDGMPKPYRVGGAQIGPNTARDIGPLPVVAADRAPIRQVRVNLIDNAVKYSGENARPRIAISPNADIAKTEIIFTIADNGVGFHMVYPDKLFGVFQRLHGPTEFEGTGIGLANARRIIIRHGGRVWAEGRIGEGATFFFTLPFPANTAPTAA